MFNIFRRKQDNNAAYVPEDFAAKKLRRARVFLFYGLVTAFFLFTAAGWFVFRSPFFRVNGVEVVGNKSVPKDAILSMALSGVIGGDYLKSFLGTDHYFNWRADMLDEEMRFIPRLKSADVSKNFRTGSVVITVEEREPRGIWCLLGARNDAEQTRNNAEKIPRASALSPRESAGTKCQWFDDEGVLFGAAPMARGSLIDAVYDYSDNNPKLGEKMLKDELLASLFSVFGVLGESGLAVKEIKLNDLELEELRVSTFNGPDIYFSLRFNSASVLPVIQNLMSKSAFEDLDYVDFRVENRAYYK